MSMAEVIKSIEREALREAQSHEIGGRNGKPIDCSTLGDELAIEAVVKIAIPFLKQTIENMSIVVTNEKAITGNANALCVTKRFITAK